MQTLHVVAPSRLEPVRVLVVDDEPPMCELVSRILGEAGYRVTTAHAGPAAIAAVAQDGTPDLLLTDFKMPQMDGDELVARLRQSTPDLKVLYLTGYSQSLFHARSVLWEGEAFLEKPCSPGALRDLVLVQPRHATSRSHRPPVPWPRGAEKVIRKLNSAR